MKNERKGRVRSHAEAPERETPALLFTYQTQRAQRTQGFIVWAGRDVSSLGGCCAGVGRDGTTKAPRTPRFYWGRTAKTAIICWGLLRGEAESAGTQKSRG